MAYGLLGKLAGAGACAVGGVYATHKYFEKDVQQRYKAIFNLDSKKDIFYEREFVSATIQNAFRDVDPSGIIFVTGRMGAGKTSTIRAVLRDVPYATHIDLRGYRDGIKTTEELVMILKKSFGIKQFKDYFRDIKVIWLIINLFQLIPIPSLRYEKDELNSLAAVLEEIKNVCKFRPPGVTTRPVIYIDEIANLTINAENEKAVRDFYDWVITCSRDERFFDFICSSSNGFYKFPVDSKYVTTITVGDLNLTEIENMLDHFSARKKIVLNFMNKHQILCDAGGNIGEAKKLCIVTSPWDYQNQLMSLRYGERDTLENAIKNAYKPVWFSKRPAGSYTAKELKSILNVFANNGAADPSIHLCELTIKADVEEHVIKALVEGHTKYLFYDPLSKCVRVRSKLFLEAFREHIAKEIWIGRIEGEIVSCKKIISDLEGSRYDEIEAAENKLIELTSELMRANSSK